ncbi:hypothetical protein [Xenorhabdus bovienii]|uniref:hypothetical protein n=1 Tax=Xenorhabdus bovienii TaxID=40576 RepID=UPI00056F6DEB|nr:hypothetical protein [Xenorhabdus bovienii]
MPKPHIHADLMMKAAKIAQTDSEWWKHFQAKNDDKIGWRNLGGEIAFIEGTGFEYRLKPCTVRIGNFDHESAELHAKALISLTAK